MTRGIAKITRDCTNWDRASGGAGQGGGAGRGGGAGQARGGHRGGRGLERHRQLWPLPGESIVKSMKRDTCRKADLLVVLAARLPDRWSRPGSIAREGDVCLSRLACRVIGLVVHLVWEDEISSQKL